MGEAEIGSANRSFGDLFGSSNFSTGDLAFRVGSVTDNWFVLKDSGKLDITLDNDIILEDGYFILTESFDRIVNEDEGTEYELGFWDVLLEDEGYLLDEGAARIGQESAATLYKPSKRVVAGIPISAYDSDTYMNWNIYDLRNEQIEPFVHNEPATLTSDFSVGDMVVFDKVKIEANVDNLQFEDASGSVLREDTHSFHLIDEDYGASSQLNNVPPATIGSSVFDPQLGHTVFITEDNNPLVHEAAVLNSSQFGYLMTEADTLYTGVSDESIIISDRKPYRVGTVDNALYMTLNKPPEPPIMDSNGWFLYKNHKIFKERTL